MREIREKDEMELHREGVRRLEEDQIKPHLVEKEKSNYHCVMTQKKKTMSNSSRCLRNRFWHLRKGSQIIGGGQNFSRGS